jgi:OmpA-OmpF porin, OOP family
VRKILCWILFFISFSLHSQNRDTCLYSDGSKAIRLPQGRISFADEVVSFKKGSPAAVPKSSDPHDAIGSPDFDGGTGGFVSIGCGGSLVLKFTDNQLIDTKGPDLYVFEKGRYLEPTHLEISRDGKRWIDIGNFEGALSSIDITGHASPGEYYTFIRLTDLRSECTGSWPGADIDAVAAIGSARVLSLNSTVSFDFSSSMLNAGGKKDLDSLFAKIVNQPEIKIVRVEGFTDSIGTQAYNLNLSTARAKAVASYLDQKLIQTGRKISFKAYGHGADDPIAPNSTEEGRQKNRRVQLVLMP